MVRPSDVAESGAESQRLDKWLWHARVTRSRSSAQKLLHGGNVRVNREKVIAPSRIIRPDDVLTIAIGTRIRVLRVKGIAPRRGSAPEASALYDEIER